MILEPVEGYRDVVCSFVLRFECVSELYWFISKMQSKTKLKVEIHGKISVNSLG